MQVYRELRILTARPGEAELALVPHRLYGVLPAAERCSAGRWRRLAEAAAAESGDRLPIFVGGTGLYLRALTLGLSEIPAVPAAIAEEGRVLLAERGASGLHAELARLDPVMAGRLAPSDSQRLYRAWTCTRRPAARSPNGRQSRLRRLAQPDLRPDCRRGASSTRPAMRGSHGMVEQGALEEVRSLLALGLDPSLPAMRALGVRELGEVIAGRQRPPLGGRGRPAGHPALCQASDDLVPPPDAGGSAHRSAIFGKNLTGNL